MITLNQKLGEIVSIFPDASEIFTKYKIDFCCGGYNTLLNALHNRGIDQEKFLDELNLAYKHFMETSKDYVDWRKAKPVELVKHILRTHHDFTKKELREIDFYLFKILKVHFEHHSDELLQVHRLFGQLKIELEEHLVKEEENLFPLIEEFEETQDKDTLEKIYRFIEETEREHDDAGDILKKLEEVTDDFRTPLGGCTTFKMVYDRIHALQKDLFRHIYLENSVLFEMF